MHMDCERSIRLYINNAMRTRVLNITLVRMRETSPYSLIIISVNT